MNEVVSQPLILRKKSRSSYLARWSGDANTFRDKLFRGLYIFLLFALDFVMFIYSVNGKILEHGDFNQAVGVIFASFLIFSLIIVFLFSFSKTLQNIVCSVFTVLFTVIFFYQFGLGNVDSFLDEWLAKHANWLSFICLFPTPWMIGIFFGLVVFGLFYFSDAILFVTLVLLFSFVIGVHKNEFLLTPMSEYREVKPMDDSIAEGRNTNIVYMMVSKLPSYQFLSSIKDVNFRELRDLMIGFYATNNFEIYPNAFVHDADAMSNIVDILNQVDYMSSSSANRGYSTFVNDWNFIHGGLEFLELSENVLYDYLHNSGFRVSMYPMPGFNFCLKSGSFYTDRCVVKGYKNVSLYDKKSSLEKNIYALLGEWVLSIQSRELKSVAKMLIDSSYLRNMRILSENRRTSIEGSAEIFERLSADFKRGVNGQAYLAYIDLPSDIYIYDEFCNIKPRKEWVALKDNSLYSGGIDEKRKAYADQAKCLIGKLQEYMDEFQSDGKSAKTDVYIQGVSPIRELAGMVSDNYSRFVAESLVNLAIRKGKNPKFLINANVCLASDFTRTLISYQDYCYSLDDMGKMSAADTINLKKNLINNSIIRGGKISNIAANYRDWYENYKANSHSYQEKMRLAKEMEVARQQREAALQHEEEVKPVRHEIETPAKKALYNQNIFVPTDDFITENDENADEEKENADEPLSKSDVSSTDVNENQQSSSEHGNDEHAVEDNPDKQQNVKEEVKKTDETEKKDDSVAIEESNKGDANAENTQQAEQIENNPVSEEASQPAEVQPSQENDKALNETKADEKPVEEEPVDDSDLELF